jgi:hypothetical protein
MFCLFRNYDEDVLYVIAALCLIGRQTSVHVTQGGDPTPMLRRLSDR